MITLKLVTYFMTVQIRQKCATCSKPGNIAKVWNRPNFYLFLVESGMICSSLIESKKSFTNFNWLQTSISLGNRDQMVVLMAFRLCVYVAFFVYLNENYCYSRLLQGIPKDTFLTKTTDNKIC